MTLSEGPFTVQQHGEWSGMPDVLDMDFEAETWEEVQKIVREEIPSGCIYQVLGADYGIIHEGTKR